MIEQRARLGGARGVIIATLGVFLVRAALQHELIPTPNRQLPTCLTARPGRSLFSGT